MFDPSLHRTQHIRLYDQFRVNLFNRVFVYCIGFCCLPLPWCILLHLNGVRCFYVSKCVILMTGSSQSLTDLLLAPCVPVHQHGPCVSVQNWFWTGFRWPLQPQGFCFSFINVVVLVSGLYEPSILIYVHCILSEGIYHDLPSSTSSFGVQLNHIMYCKSTVMRFLLEQSDWTYGWGILLSNPVLNILLFFGVSCVKHRLQTAYSTECCQFLCCLNSTREACRLETCGHKCFPPLYKQVSGVCM